MLYDGLNGCKIGLIAISPMYRFHQQQSGIIQTFYVPTHRTQVEPSCWAISRDVIDCSDIAWSIFIRAGLPKSRNA